jgi:flagellar motor switch/type III secretory pathway protein FliN
MNMSIKDILAIDEGTLSISEDPADQTVDIILDRTIEF